MGHITCKSMGRVFGVVRRYVANSKKSKMAAGKNRFMTKSQNLYIENQIQFANII